MGLVLVDDFELGDKVVLGYLVIASVKAAETENCQGAVPFPSAQIQKAAAPCRQCILYRS
jgi:hypothetical protein